MVGLAILFLMYPAGATNKKVSKKSEITKKAQVEYAKANYEKAYHLFREAIQKGDATGEPRFFLGLIVEAWRRYRESIDYFKKALQRSLDKKYKKVALWKTILYMEQVADHAQLLEYADRLKKIIGDNRKLNEIIQNSEFKISPTHIEARRLLNEAFHLEASFSKDKKEKNFWQDHESKILEIASIYKTVSGMDERYRNYLWKSAYYYENTNQFEDAFRDYQSILAFSPDNARAKYKIGIIYKKQMRYQDAEGYLLEVYKQKRLESILNFYTAINLSQIYYSLRDFPRSNQFAKVALAKRYRKHRSSSQNNLLRLLSCNTRIPLKKILLKKKLKDIQSLRRSNIPCSRLLKRWKKLTKIKTEIAQIEYVLSRLLNAKQNHLNYLVSKKINYLKRAEKNYTLAFLPERMYHIGDSHAPGSDLKKVNSKSSESPNELVSKVRDENTFKIQDWLSAELSELASFLYGRRSYSLLYDLLIKYRPRLELEEQFNRWLAISSFQEKEYEISTRVYLQIMDRSLAEEKNLLLGYSFLKKWSDLRSEVNSYVNSFEDKKSDLISFIRSNPAFEAFRNENEYEDLIEELEIDE